MKLFGAGHGGVAGTLDDGANGVLAEPHLPADQAVAVAARNHKQPDAQSRPISDAN